MLSFLLSTKLSRSHVLVRQNLAKSVKAPVHNLKLAFVYSSLELAL